MTLLIYTLFKKIKYVINLKLYLFTCYSVIKLILEHLNKKAFLIFLSLNYLYLNYCVK